MAQSRCFISYSWDSADHKDWVRHLATELQRNGVVTHLDQWDVHPGMDLTKYMETRIRESDFVLLVCTPTFAQKANAGRGGVGYEKSIVTGEIFEGSASSTKFVPLIRKGTQAESLPSYLKSRAYINFRDNVTFADGLEALLRHLYQSPKYVRPPLGPAPRLKPVSGEQPVDAEQAPGEFQVASFKAVYEFAYSPDGLDLPTKAEAAGWATAWAGRLADRDFEKFQEMYRFAYGVDGLDLPSKAEAAKWAILWMERLADRDFEEFQEMYRFAYDVDGLDLPCPTTIIITH